MPLLPSRARIYFTFPESGLALRFALTNIMQWKWCWWVPDLGLQRCSNYHFCPPEFQPACNEIGLSCWRAPSEGKRLRSGAVGRKMLSTWRSSRKRERDVAWEWEGTKDKLYLLGLDVWPRRNQGMKHRGFMMVVLIGLGDLLACPGFDTYQGWSCHCWLVTGKMMSITASESCWYRAFFLGISLGNWLPSTYCLAKAP